MQSAKGVASFPLFKVADSSLHVAAVASIYLDSLLNSPSASPNMTNEVTTVGSTTHPKIFRLWIVGSQLELTPIALHACCTYGAILQL